MKFHHTDDAPKAIGPYSQSVSIDGWLYTSGQVALDPATGELVPGGSNVVKATVYVADLADFPKLNAIYAENMGDHRPARSTVQVAGLPKGALVEIDLVARIP
jgi:2-iminobutanoate/2-iminopropanoate deaminase